MYDAWNLLRAESPYWAMEGLESFAAAIEAGAVSASRRPLPSSAARVAGIGIVGPLVKSGWPLAELFGLSTYDGIRSQVAQAVTDRSVDRILLWTDSNGGSAQGCEEAAYDIYQAGKIKPVSAYIAGNANSAAYWLISGASAGIISTPSGEAGSIGVRALSVSIRESLLKSGIKAENHVSKISPYKAEGSDLEDLSDESRAAIQADLDHIAEKFVRSIVRGRGVSAAAVKADFGKGRVLFSGPALAAGMIDKISANPADALNFTPSSSRAAQLSRLSGQQPADRQVAARRRRLQLFRFS